MSAQTALIIDDEPDIRELVSITVSRLGLECHTAANLDDARNVLKQCNIDVCLTDMRLPDGNGVDFVKYMQETYPDIPTAVITAHGNMDAAVTAMKNGAFDFVSKPVDLTLLRKLIESAAKSSGTGMSTEEFSRIDEKNSKLSSIDSRLLGGSPPMQKLKKMIIKLAKSQAPVLVNGESGTGKELVARLIHDLSPRSEKPFVPINCGAIPPELMESEFFGHKKGSFTGATENKTGLFQAAEDGTLFLDEIAELPLFMQVKLLRVIQEKAVRPVGENREIPINVRIISASYKDLENEVEEERFRHDLFYRLNVIGLMVPPLRNRPSDISDLTQHILSNISKNRGEEKTFPISKEAIQSLEKYRFPGNVRELENTLERALALTDNEILYPEDLFLNTSIDTDNSIELCDSSANETGEQESVSSEAKMIMDTLEKTHWNRKEAAKALGLSYRQLRYRLQKIQEK